MLLLSTLNCNAPEIDKNQILPYHEQGIVLIVVLWIITLISGIIIPLFSSTILNTKLTVSLLTEAQQFEAAEAGLLEAEKQLAQLILKIPTTVTNSRFTLSSMIYAGYYVTLNAVRLPQAFCLLPMRTKGYYYQLTATAQSQHSSYIAPLIRLQTIVALPSSEKCNDDLLNRQAGRSAWCQLS